MKVSIPDQVACVTREIEKRESFYPKWVLAGRMKEDKAKAEIAAMKAVLRTLLMLKPLAPLLEMPDHHDQTNDET